MEALQKLKGTVQDMAAAGGRRVDDLKDARRRKALLAELGELTYRKHRGDPIDETAIDPVLAELDGIEAASDQADESDAA